MEYAVVLSILGGWALGLLTLPISETIKWKFFQKKQLLGSIKLELEEIQIKFVFLS